MLLSGKESQSRHYNNKTMLQQSIYFQTERETTKEDHAANNIYGTTLAAVILSFKAYPLMKVNSHTYTLIKSEFNKLVELKILY